MKKISLMLIIALSITVIFAQGFGQKGNSKNFRRKNHLRENRGQMRSYAFITELNLSEKQQENIGKIRDKHQKTMIDLRAQLSKLNIDKRNAMRNADFVKAEKISDKISAQRSIMAKDRIKLRAQIYKLLTKEQQEKFKSLEREYRPMMRRPMREGGYGMNKMPHNNMGNNLGN